MATAAVRRGRPKIHEDEAILEAALREFAIKGYEGTSLRSLNSDLGLSHGTINMRFGSKDQLYLEAVDHSFTALLADTKAIVDSQPLPDDPLEELRIRFRAFLLASARRPFLNRLINNEGVHSSPLLDHIFDTFILPSTRPTRRLMKRLVAEGVLAPHSERSILFLLAPQLEGEEGQSLCANLWRQCSILLGRNRRADLRMPPSHDDAARSPVGQQPHYQRSRRPR